VQRVTAMTRLLLPLAAAAAVAAAASGNSAPAAGAGSCATGMHRVTVRGHPGFRFCGPASAVVHMGGRTLRFSNGLCRRAAGAFTVNIGTLVPGLRSGKPPYFGITTHTARAGTQRNAALGFTYRGRHYAIADQVVTLAPGLQKGTFSGRVLASTTRVSGSFRC
jgi:hypothetical protein